MRWVGTASEQDPEYKKFLEGFAEVERKGHPAGAYARKDGKIWVRKTALEKFLGNGSVPKRFCTPHIAGIEISYQPGDKVKTRDGRDGKCVGSIWTVDLINDEKLDVGDFISKIDFGDHFEYHDRDDLTGSRFKSIDEHFDEVEKMLESKKGYAPKSTAD